MTLLLLLILPIVIAQAGPGPCHPFPGAEAKDCLELIGQHLRDDTTTTCDEYRRATLSLRNCVITTACAQGQDAIANDEAVRRALTTIGKCALSDYGSISGYYIADDGAKTCYLYPGKEGSCTL